VAKESEAQVSVAADAVESGFGKVGNLVDSV
jgi:hypothetical protein